MLNPPPAAPQFRRTVGQLAQATTQSTKPPVEKPTVPVGLGLAKLYMRPKMQMNAKVRF